MSSRFKIYTKSGDQGLTKLVDGQECSKAHLRVETYGTVDELNSHIGLLLSFLAAPKMDPCRQEVQPFLVQVQNQLFNLGSHIACEKRETRKLLPLLQESWIETIEKKIDELDAALPELKNFILPGGTPSASQSHIARTICRRAERLTVALIEEGGREIELTFCLKYLNRLSDLFFVLARWLNLKKQISDQLWQKS